MTARTSQRLIAASFILAATSVFLIFVHIRAISGATLPLSAGTVLGALGWLLLIAACAVVILHPKPEATFLGRFAVQKEPLLRGSAIGAKRFIATLAVAAIAIVSAMTALLAFTGGLNALFEKYVF